MVSSSFRDHETPTARYGWQTASSHGVVSLYQPRVARIARGELTKAERARLNGRAACIDAQWRGGVFNGFEFFHFQVAQHAATMAAFFVAYQGQREDKPAKEVARAIPHPARRSG